MLVLALLLGTLGKKVNVPSVLLLLTPPGDMESFETLGSAGHKSRSATLKKSTHDHPIPAPASPAGSVLGVVPCASGGTAHPCMQTNLIHAPLSPGLYLEWEDGFVLDGREVWGLTPHREVHQGPCCSSSSRACW